MRRLPRAESAFTYDRSGQSAAGRNAFALATRGASRDFDGSGAPSLARPKAAFLVLVATAFALLVAAPFAQAGMSVDRFVGGPAGGAAGDEFGSAPADVAVNVSGAGSADPGDVYVLDQSSQRVAVYDSSGSFKFVFGRDVVATGRPGDLGDEVLEVCAVAADCKKGEFGIVGGALVNPVGIEVDQASGEVYVRERGESRRIQRFGPGGQFLAAWGYDVIQAGKLGDLGTATFEVCTVAADCQAGSAAGTGDAAGQFGTSGSTNVPGLVISPANGHVFAADTVNERILEFDPDAVNPADVFVRGWGWEVDNAGSAKFEVCTTASACKAAGSAGTNNGRFAANSPQFLAVDSQNVVYASDSSSSTSANRIVRFDADLAPASGDATAALLPPILSTAGGGPLMAGVTFGLHVDPDPDGPGAGVDRLFVVRDPSSGETVVQELSGLPGAPAIADEHAKGAGFAAIRSTAYDPAADRLFLNGSFTVGFGYFVLDDDGTGPLGTPAFTGADASTTSADLEGELDPGGYARYRFEVSLDGSVWEPVGPFQGVEGGGTVGISATVTGLQPNTVYRVRIAAKKSPGPATTLTATSAEGNFVTDSAPPTVVTAAVGPRGATGAELRGRIDPNGTATTYWFEYGGSTAYGSVTPPIPASAGSGNDELLFAQAVSGLAPATTYHYRIVADGFGPPVAGGDQSFATQPVPAPPTPNPARTYELVTPADKQGDIGVGEYYQGLGSMVSAGVAAYEGERFAAMGSFGSVLLGDPAFSFANDWALAERHGSTLGWRSHTPLSHPSRTPALASFLGLKATSADLSRFAWSANATPSFFPELAGGDQPNWQSFSAIWLSDLGSQTSPTRWELAGPGALDQVDLTRLAAPAGNNAPLEVSLSHDGSAAVVLTRKDGGGPLPMVHGLAGPGDPTWPTFGDLVSGRSVYLADLSQGLTDSAQVGERELVNVCTGAAGPARTRLPVVNAGKISDLECPPPGVGRDAQLISDHGATTGVRNGGSSVAGSISADGRRVFFLSPDPIAAGVPNGTSLFCSGSGASTLCPPQLFVSQEMPDGSRVVRWVSKAEPGLFGNQDASLIGTARFEGATPDGDKVFFRTNAPLTADDRNGGGAPPPGGVVSGTVSNVSWDLYMYDLPDAPGSDPGDGELTRISAGPDGADPDSFGDGDCNSPLPDPANDPDNRRVNALRFASGNGARLYFTCAAPLPGVPAAQDGTVTSPGGTQTTPDQTNLYLYDAGLPASDRWRFVARLPRVVTGTGPGSGSLDVCASTGSVRMPPLGVDPQEFGSVNLDPAKEANCVRGTDDGAFLTFLTQGRLTADDPPGTAADVYAYDAELDELVRISAPRGGATGGPYQCATASGPACHADDGIIPTGIISFQGGAVNTPLGLVTVPSTPGERIAFFQSRARLVTADVDDDYDVYQWRNGELSLISSGQSLTDGAVYLGNDETGQNVYFVTRDRLSWQDVDAAADVYTARVGSGVEQPLAPPLCSVLADACQGAPDAAPAAGAAASAAFAGTGNVAPRPQRPKCGKSKIRRGKRCVKKKPRKRSASAKQRANDYRGVSK